MESSRTSPRTNQDGKTSIVKPCVGDEAMLCSLGMTLLRPPAKGVCFDYYDVVGSILCLTRGASPVSSLLDATPLYFVCIPKLFNSTRTFCICKLSHSSKPPPYSLRIVQQIVVQSSPWENRRRDTRAGKLAAQWTRRKLKECCAAVVITRTDRQLTRAIDNALAWGKFERETGVRVGWL